MMWQLSNGEKQHLDGREIESIWCEHHSIAHHMENNQGDVTKEE